MGEVTSAGAIVFLGLIALFGWLRWLSFKERTSSSLSALDIAERRLDSRIEYLHESIGNARTVLDQHEARFGAQSIRIGELGDNIKVVHKDLADFSKMTKEEIDRLKGRDSMRSMSATTKGVPF